MAATLTYLNACYNAETHSVAFLSLLRSPQVILSRCHDGVLHRILLRHTCRNRVQRHLAIQSIEKWNAVPLPAALVDDPMHRANEEIIRLPHEAVRNVDDKAIRHWLCLYPFPALPQHLEPARHVLIDDGEAFEVRVRSNTVLVVHAVLLLRVVQDPHPGLGPLNVLVKVVFGQVQREGEDLSHFPRELEHRCVVGVHDFFEAGQLGPDARAWVVGLVFRVLLGGVGEVECFAQV